MAATAPTAMRSSTTPSALVLSPRSLLMRGMYGAHDAISAPLTKKTAVTASARLRRSPGVVTAA